MASAKKSSLDVANKVLWRDLCMCRGDDDDEGIHLADADDVVGEDGEKASTSSMAQSHMNASALDVVCFMLMVMNEKGICQASQGLREAKRQCGGEGKIPSTRFMLCPART